MQHCPKSPKQVALRDAPRVLIGWIGFPLFSIVMNYLFPIFACLLWGTNTVVTKVAATAVGPIDISFLRWAIATLVLAPFALPSLLKKKVIVRRNLGRFLILGCLGGVIYQCTAYYAAHFTSATNMGIIQSLIPLIALGLSRAFLGLRISRSAVVGSAISASGVVLVVSKGNFSTLAAQGLNRGDACMILGALAFATYNLLTHRWKFTITFVESLFLQATAASIVLLPLWVVLGKGITSKVGFGCIGFAALGASIAAPLTWMTGIARLGSARVSGFFNLVPIVTALIAIFALSESLKLWAAWGGLQAVFGVVIAEYAASRKPRPVMATVAPSTACDP